MMHWPSSRPSIDCSGASGFGYRFDDASPNPIGAQATDLAGNLASAAGSFAIVVTSDGIGLRDRPVRHRREARRGPAQELEKVSKDDEKISTKDQAAKRSESSAEVARSAVGPDDLTTDEAEHLIAPQETLIASPA